MKCVMPTVVDCLAGAVALVSLGLYQSLCTFPTTSQWMIVSVEGDFVGAKFFFYTFSHIGWLRDSVVLFEWIVASLTLFGINRLKHILAVTCNHQM